MSPGGGGGDEGSVTHWLADLKAGDPNAASPLWDRYFARLVQLARRKLIAARRQGADADEEDAAVSAFESFCEGAAAGKFPLLADRDDLWKLLVVITARKAAGQADRRRALKRGGDRVAIEFADPDGPDAFQPGRAMTIDQVVGHEPTPEFAAMVAEEYRLLLDRLGDDTLRSVALWRMEGYNNDEIAEQLGCARRTVARRLDLIRRIWDDAAPGGEDSSD